MKKKQPNLNRNDYVFILACILYVTSFLTSITIMLDSLKSYELGMPLLTVILTTAAKLTILMGSLLLIVYIGKTPLRKYGEKQQ